MINRKAFFDRIRVKPFKGSLTQSQVEGIEVILDEWERRKLTDLRHLSYMLATTYHETDRTMQPIYEKGSRAYFDKYDAGTSIGAVLGNTVKGDGYLYRGRGLPQLTGRSNYTRMKDITGYNLVGNPDLALQPKIAVTIMFEGMIRGMFTGKKLADYFNQTTTDWVNARRVVNVLDRADLIAGYAKEFHSALGAAGQIPGTAPVKPPVKPPPKPGSGAGAVVGTICAGGGAAAAAHQAGASTTTTVMLTLVAVGVVLAIIALFRNFKKQGTA